MNTAHDTVSLRWGLIGASTIAADWVLPAMRAVPGHQPVALYSSSPERGRAYAERHGIPAVEHDLGAFFCRPDIDAVYISTTNDRHAPEIHAAAAAGKHVLSEKPLALTVADARDAVVACERAGVVLAVNHHFRNGACVRAARDLVAAGEIGRPLAVRMAQAFLLPEALRGWRLAAPAAGAGAILDLTVHDVDVLRYVLDDEVAEVTALAASQVFGADAGIEDMAMGVLRFEGGVLASFYDAFNAPDGGSSLEVHGTKGTIVIEEALDERLIDRLVLRRDGRTEELDSGPREDLYVHGLERFAEAVAGRGVPAVSGEDGVRSLAVALAVRRAATTRTTVLVGPVETGLAEVAS